LRNELAMRTLTIEFRRLREFAMMVLCAFAAVLPARASLVSYTDLLARPRPSPTAVVRYGPAEQQQGALFLPAGKGPHPVAVLIHGGCWLAKLPGPELMEPLAADLQYRGYAVWNIGYRRLGHDGGGYPGTFLDVANAMDELRTLAPANGLDLKRVIVIGHSAGGQLALWAAARPRLPKTSVLYRPDPLPVSGVVSVAGINDLEDFRAHGPGACGEPRTVDRLTGPATSEHPDVYEDISPARLLPIGVPYAIVSSELDDIVPKRFGAQFAAKARATRDAVREIEVANVGHFDLIDPQSAAWKQQIVPELDRLAK
jgi:acetyl esterase/lipase